MRFSRWVVFTFLVQLVVIAVDKGAGLVLLALTQDNAAVKGTADLLSGLPFLLTALANLGLATSLVYFLRRREFGVREIAETTALVAIVWGLAIGALTFAGVHGILPLFKPDFAPSPWITAPLCLCIPLLLLTSYFNSIQLASDRIRDYGLVHVAASALFLPLFVLLYFVSGREAAGAIAYGRLGASALVALLVVWLVRDLVRLRPRLHRGFFRAGLRYGWKANLTSVTTYLNHRLDLYLVAVLFAAGLDAAKAQAGYYSLAVGFAQLVWHFPEATRDLFFSKVAGVSHGEARRLTPILCRLSLLSAVVGSMAVYLAVPWVIAMVTSEVNTAGWVLRVQEPLLVLIPGTATFTVAKILQNDLAARGHLDPCIRACFLNLLLMVALDVVLVPEHGAVGAAWASTTAYMVSAAYTLFAYQRAGGATWWRCLVPVRSDAYYAREIAHAVLEKLRLRKRTA
ncbi:MAG: polysaccharide biosynthesis C-terminal domain-containing protein [Planctomycetes bacterium]|nr:polysaccharide biosynthesis C-terminal domain-containing protein [Planctomycetota bacterium]